LTDLIEANKAHACVQKNVLRKGRGEAPIVFDFKFRCKEDARQPIRVDKDKRNLPDKCIYASTFTPMMEASEQSLPFTLHCDGRLSRERADD
jgi:hypothetical protein